MSRTRYIIAGIMLTAMLLLVGQDVGRACLTPVFLGYLGEGL